MGAYELQTGPCVRPRCTVKLSSAKVRLKGKKGTRGRARVKFRCSQDVAARLAGRVRVKRPGKVAKTIVLKPLVTPLKANSARTLGVKLPKAALKALGAGAKVSLRLTLTAKNAHGATGTAKVSFRRLKPKS
jgi:hypothetical protein